MGKNVGAHGDLFVGRFLGCVIEGHPPGRHPIDGGVVLYNLQGSQR